MCEALENQQRHLFCQNKKSPEREKYSLEQILTNPCTQGTKLQILSSVIFINRMVYTTGVIVLFLVNLEIFSCELAAVSNLNYITGHI